MDAVSKVETYLAGRAVGMHWGLVVTTTLADIARNTQLSRNTVRSALNKLKHERKVVFHDGSWRRVVWS